MKTTILSVEPGTDLRLDKYLTIHLEDHSRTKVQQLVKSGLVTVNGMPAKSSLKLEGGEEIKIKINELPSQPEYIEPQKIDLDIIYEDDSFAVINKPAGLVVHPGQGNNDGTLVNALAHHFQDLSDINGPLRPGIVHRLDKNTSGLILVAKSNLAHQHLAHQFEQREVRKTYLGVTWGEWKSAAGKIDIGIRRQRSDYTRFEASEEGKPAVTEFEVQEQYRYLSYVKLMPRTGRTHQIRVHCSHSGFAIFADDVYNGGLSRTKGYMPEVRRIFKGLLDNLGRHALHAFQIEFTHPVTARTVQFEAPLPDDMTELITKIREFNV